MSVSGVLDFSFVVDISMKLATSSNTFRRVGGEGGGGGRKKKQRRKEKKRRRKRSRGRRITYVLEKVL